ncbi:hypothetical protein [Streptomyces sp. NPDC058674]|uniref:hypothetical protein n=1 Tax=Streptomyces sp. NPDC058674 TaxID=3346592 RepID=UPI003663F8ED
MTVLVVGVPEGEPLELLRSGIQRNPHFRVVSHAHDAAVALAHARVLLPDITVLTLPAGLDGLDADPEVLGVFHGVRALDPRAGWSCGPRPAGCPARCPPSRSTGPSTSCARETPMP